MTTTTTHRFDDYVIGNDHRLFACHFRATCVCGWMSQPVESKALASAAWREHFRTEGRAA